VWNAFDEAANEDRLADDRTLRFPRSDTEPDLLRLILLPHFQTAEEIAEEWVVSPPNLSIRPPKRLDSKEVSNLD